MLQDKVITITGAASGIGRAAAQIFAKAGAKIIAGDCDEAGVVDTVETIRKGGGTAHPLHVDVACEIACKSMVDRAIELFGRIDGSLNNAGVKPTQKLVEDLTEADWDRVQAINLKGIFLCMRHQIPAMRRTGGGAIVNISSGNGIVGNPYAADYVASKHGVVGLTRAASCEAGITKVRVNAVLPGIILTPMIEAIRQDPAFQPIWDSSLERHTVGRFGTPEDIAYAAKWLLSDEASFMNGAAVTCDGGYTAR